MKRNQILFLLLFMLVMMFSVTVVNAQSSELPEVDFKEVMKNLLPRNGELTPKGNDFLIFDIFLYIIFFISLVNSALISEKQLFVTLLNFFVLGLAVVSKLLIGYPENDPILKFDDFPVLLINAGMFVLPFMVAGMARSHKGVKSKAPMPAIFQGLVGGTYFFLFWYLEQNDGRAPTRAETGSIIPFIQYYVGFFGL